MGTSTDTTVSPEIRDQVAEYAHAQFVRASEGVVERLRRLADDVERDLSRAKDARHGEVVANAAHTLTWGMANLNADQLIRFAHDSDIAAKDAEAAHA